jgi:hypothetical protein
MNKHMLILRKYYFSIMFWTFICHINIWWNFPLFGINILITNHCVLVSPLSPVHKLTQQ